MKGKRFAAIVLLTLFGLVLAACAPGATPTPSVKEPIKVGILLSKTGAMSPFELFYYKGALMAVDEVNAAGGINGRRIQVFDYDAESNSEIALTKLKKLDREHGVVAIVGPGTAYVHNAMVAAMEEMKVPAVAINGGLHYWRPVPRYSLTIEVGGWFMTEGIMKYWKKKGVKSIVMLTTADATGEGAIKEVNVLGEQMGIEIKGIETRPSTDTEFTAVMQKLLGLKPEAVYLYVSPPSFVIPALNTLADLGWTGDIGYTGAARLRFMLKGVKPAAGDRFRMATFPVVGYDQLKADHPMRNYINDWVEQYKARYAEEPELAANGYVAMMQVIDAVKAVGPDREKVRTWLADIKDWKGVNGITYNRQDGVDIEGLKTEDLLIYRWDGAAGKFVIVEYLK